MNFYIDKSYAGFLPIANIGIRFDVHALLKAFIRYITLKLRDIFLYIGIVLHHKGKGNVDWIGYAKPRVALVLTSVSLPPEFVVVLDSLSRNTGPV